MELSTGDVARAAGITEKTVRLYADRGLVAARRSGGGMRVFDAVGLARIRRIVALRRVDLSLAEIAHILAAADPVAQFDEIWSDRRIRFVDLVAAGERARDALLAEPSDGDAGGELPTVVFENCDGHLRLSLEVRADLAGVPQQIGAATAELFATLRAAKVDLVDHPYVEYPERITRQRPGRLLVHIPIAAPVVPAGAQTLTRREACTEAVVELDRIRAREQRLIIIAHDLLSRQRFSGASAITGSTREVYLPSFGDPEAVGTVMEIRVPIQPAASPASS